MSNIDDILDQFVNGYNVYLPNNKVVDEAFKDLVILVTGAAGSIGSGLVKQLSFCSFKKLIILDIAESGLYDLQQELVINNIQNFETVICDIRNIERLEHVFSAFKPNLIIHTAAYKHVPLMEHNPYEAVTTNVLGTYNVSKLSEKYNVNKFVFISSDKAVNPISIMGATKRVAELCVNYFGEKKLKKTKFVTIRFGNVFGSNGSVVPLFKKQIENGGPITLTHKAIDRYFMPIQEAVQLILETTSLSNESETYIFDMGKPVKIFELARKMISQQGLNYPDDINVKIIGLRPGEKLEEELYFSYETLQSTSNNKIKLVENKKVFDYQEIERKLYDLCSIHPNMDKQEIVSEIKKLVPEYNSTV